MEFEQNKEKEEASESEKKETIESNELKTLDETVKEESSKQNKPKNSNIKIVKKHRFMSEIRKIKWSTIKETNRSFIITLITILIFMIIFFSFSLLFNNFLEWFSSLI